MHNGDFSKVFLAGFSQGALISIFVSLTLDDGLLGGIFAHSGAIFPYL
jgi:predicted esterase